MTKDQMIKLLVEDRLADWVYARNTDGLEEILIVGWKGYEKYTKKELQEAVEELDSGVNKEDN